MSGLRIGFCGAVVTDDVSRDLSGLSFAPEQLRFRLRVPWMPPLIPRWWPYSRRI